MAKAKNELVEIEDETPHPPTHAAALAEPIAAAVVAQAAQVAPSMDDVLAYWTPGREKTMEVPGCIAAHSVPCATCGAMLPYIPTAEGVVPVLVCGSH